MVLAANREDRPSSLLRPTPRKRWQALGTVVIGTILLWLTNLPHVAVERNYYPADWPEWLRFAWLLAFSPVNSLLTGILVGWIVTRVGKKPSRHYLTELVKLLVPRRNLAHGRFLFPRAWPRAAWRPTT